MAVSRRISLLNSKLKVGPMKRLYKYYTPSSINLAGGVPMDSTFPIEKMTINLIHNEELELIKGKNLSLNYLRGDGLPNLKEWITNHMKLLHQPISNEIQNCTTIGSTDALSKIFLLLNGNCVFFDEYAYGTAVSTARTFDRKCYGIKMDSDGMIPSDLKMQTLLARDNGLEPDIVYLVPTAHNPTGMTMSYKRKQEIYEICQELDLIIVEDDAYYYLYHDKKLSFHDEINSNELPGLRGLPKSFLSMDTDERVIRLDSLSKFICPGMRLGWVSGPPSFVEKYMLLQEITSQFPSGLSQSTFLGIVNQWGDDRLHTHLQEIQSHYLRQRNFMCRAIESHLGSIPTPHPGNDPLYSYALPDGGMFIFLKFPYHYLPFTSEELFRQLASVGVIIVPGDDFYVSSIEEELNSVSSNHTSNPKEVTLRLTYAAAQPPAINEGIGRLSNGIQNILKSLSK